MKPIGVVGGIGPESTIDDYRAMIAAYRERRPDGSDPPIVLGTRLTMQSRFYHDLFERSGMAVVVPGETEQRTSTTRT